MEILLQNRVVLVCMFCWKITNLFGKQGGVTLYLVVWTLVSPKENIFLCNNAYLAAGVYFFVIFFVVVGV